MFGSAGFEALYDIPIVLQGIKWLIVTSFLLYSVFAFIVTRQIHIMRRTLITSFSSVIRVLGYAHFILAVGLTLLFFIIL